MSEPEKLEYRKLPVKYIVPPTIQPLFTNNAVVQHDQQHFAISFYEVWPPLILGETDEDKLEYFQAVDHVDAKCVAKIVMSPADLRDLIDALTENLAKHEARFGKIPPKKDGE